MIDVIIPTCKTAQATAPQVDAILDTAGCLAKIFVTCEPTWSAAQNRNLGLKSADLDIVVMVDDDVCEFPPGWLYHLTGTLETEHECVLVSARLLNEDGTPGPMTGEPPPTASTGLTVAKRLPTACIAFRNDGLRFDENFVGSGFEDDDFCAQLRQKYPTGTFIINEDVRVVHKNEMKNQGFIKGKGPVPGGVFEKNQAYYESKWGERA